MKLDKSDLLDSIDAYLYSTSQLELVKKLNLPVGDEIHYALIKHENMLYRE